MKKFTKLQIAHFSFLALMILFIAIYFSEIRPEKYRSLCAEKTAKTILELNPPDAYEQYQIMFKNCQENSLKIDIVGL